MNGFRVWPGDSGAGFVPISCQKSGIGVEVRILVSISPSFCSQTGLGSNKTNSM